MGDFKKRHLYPLAIGCLGAMLIVTLAGFAGEYLFGDDFHRSFEHNMVSLLVAVIMFWWGHGHGYSEGHEDGYTEGHEVGRGDHCG